MYNILTNKHQSNIRSSNTSTPTQEEGPKLRSACVMRPLSNSSILHQHHTSEGYDQRIEPSVGFYHRISDKTLDMPLQQQENVDDRMSGWYVPEVLKNVPPHYPLAPGHCTIFVPHTKPSVVATRVFKCLRDQSIEAVYNHEDAKVQCRTMGLVDFQVSLFAGRNDYSHGVIVEVRRRNGCSLAFFRSRCAVTLAAEGKEYTNEAIIDCSDKHQLLDMDIDEDEEEMYANEAFDESMALLGKERQDAQALGVESLANLTDASKSGEGISLRASVRLLKENDASYIKHVKAFISNPEAQMAQCDYDEQHYELMRYASLVVLANSLTSSNESKLYIYPGTSDVVVQELTGLVEVLVNQLRDAEVRLHGAYFAAKALNALLNNWPGVDVRSQVPRKVLVKANYTGHNCHAQLEEESGILLVKMDN